MRKRFIAILLAISLMFVLPVSGESPVEEIFFVAYNDTLPMTLPVSEQPYHSEGAMLTSHNVFTVAGLDISAAFDAETKVLQLYTRNSRLKFELTKGLVTDEKGVVTEVLCTYRNSIAYIPLDFCVAHFDLQYSFLTSIDGYSVLRLMNGQQVYSDSKFIDRAENLIDYRVQHYLLEKQAQMQPVVPETPEKPNRVEGHVTAYLAICGAENMPQALSELARRQAAATFFLTEQEITENPDLVREIASLGYPIGLTAEEGEQDLSGALARANEQLDAILHRKTLLALLTRQQCSNLNGYFTIAKEAATSVYDAIATDDDCLIICEKNTYQNVLLLSGASANFRLLRETSPFS